MFCPSYYILSKSSVAARFHELNQAYELLLDPVKRNNLNASLSTKQAHKERLKKFDAKRSAMQSELEEAERTAKRAKMEKAKQDRQRQEEAGRIQEEGRRMREAKEEVLRRQSEELTKVKETQKSFELGKSLRHFVTLNCTKRSQRQQGLSIPQCGSSIRFQNTLI